MNKNKIKDYYANDIEANRLETEAFKLEGIRTKEIIGSYLQQTNLQILDIGGGAGYYSFWLQEKGHHVTLIDLSPRNIELARNHEQTNGITLTKIDTGNATDLQFPNDQFDIVLLLGPLYHLIERSERVKALAEARRVLKPGAVLLCAIISRYASLFDGFQRDLVLDDPFFQILQNDLLTGTHINDTDNLEYFTTAYFHRPKEIVTEIEEAGLFFKKLIAIESFGWIISNLKEKLTVPSYMEKLLNTIRKVEEDEDLMAMSPHIMAVAKKF